MPLGVVAISHRGNDVGPCPERENAPDYIDEAIAGGYFVEIDLWEEHGKLFLGHDGPQYPIEPEWLSNRKSRLIVHCKNFKALYFMSSYMSGHHFFFHQNDDYTLTSKGHIWVFPGQKYYRNCIIVQNDVGDLNWGSPELADIVGICSDNIAKLWYERRTCHTPRAV